MAIRPNESSGFDARGKTLRETIQGAILDQLAWKLKDEMARAQPRHIVAEYEPSPRISGITITANDTYAKNVVAFFKQYEIPLASVPLSETDANGHRLFRWTLRVTPEVIDTLLTEEEQKDLTDAAKEAAIKTMGDAWARANALSVEAGMARLHPVDEAAAAAGIRRLVEEFMSGQIAAGPATAARV